MPNPNPFLRSPLTDVADEANANVIAAAQQQAPVDEPIPALPVGPTTPAPAPAPVQTAPPRAQSLTPPPELNDVFEASAKAYGVPVNVLMALAHQESGYNPAAVGQDTKYGKAQGIMQFLGSTAKGLGIDPLDPNQAIPAAAKQLSDRLKAGASMDDAIMEHFAGPDRSGWKEKTAAYGKEVLDKAGQIGAQLYGPVPDAPAFGANLDPNKLSTSMNKAEYLADFMKVNPDASADAQKFVMDQYDKAAAERTKQAGNRVQDKFAQMASPDATFNAKLNAKLQAGNQGVAQVLPSNQQPSKLAPPVQDQSLLKTIGANVTGGALGTLTGALSAGNALIGDDAAAKEYDEGKQQIQGVMNQNGGETLAGKASALVGGVAPALAVPAEAVPQIVANAGLFAIPAYRDTYKQQIDMGRDKTLAMAHAAAAFGINMLAPTVAAKGMGAIAGRLGTDGLQGVGGAAAAIGQAAVEGAGFSAANTAIDKGIDTIAGQKNDNAWIDTHDMAASALGFAALRGGHALAAGGRAPLPADATPEQRIAAAQEHVAEIQQPPAQRAQDAAEVVGARPEPDAPQDHFVIQGEDGSTHVLTSDGTLVESVPPPAPAGPLTAALGDAMKEHAANPQPIIEAPRAPEPVAPPEPPAIESFPTDALKSRLEEVSASIKENRTPELVAERKKLNSEIKARNAEAVAASKPAEEPVTMGPFDERADANRMMIRAAESTGVAHEVVEKSGKYEIQPLKESGHDVSGRSDDGGRGNRPVDSAGSDNGARPEGDAVVPGDGRTGDAGRRSAGNEPDHAGASPTADAKPALKEWEKNPYSGYSFTTPEAADAFFGKKGIDRNQFEAVQHGEKKWKVQPRENDVSGAAEAPAEVPASDSSVIAKPAAKAARKPRAVSKVDSAEVPLHDKPLAAEGLTSYRYKGQYGWIMVGAKGHAEALSEAKRSFSNEADTPVIDKLQVWDGKKYVPASDAPERTTKQKTSKALPKPEPVEEVPAPTKAKKSRAKIAASDVPELYDIADKKTAKDDRDLIIAHNLTEANLLHAHKMGGIAVPSLAVTRKGQSLKSFGEITMIGSREMADPKGYAKTKVYGADIYSPRYPSVEHEIDSKAKSNFNKKFAPMAEKLGVRVPESDDLSSNGQREIERSLPVMAEFVKSKGLDPKIVMREGKLNEARIERLKKFGLGEFLDKTSIYDLTENPKFMRAAADEAIDAYRASGDDRMAKRADRLAGDPEAQLNVARDLAYQIINDAKARKAPEADKYATQTALEKQIEDAGLSKDYQNYAKSELTQLSKGERIFKGHTASGNRTYIPHTLENVVKILKKELRGGENFNYGVGSLRAHFTPEFKSIEQIKKSKDRLVSSEEFEQVKKEIDDEFVAVGNAIGKDLNMDKTIAILEDAPKIGLDRAAANFNVKLSDDARVRAAEFLKKLQHLPTEYFEAKILRDVHLSEFSGAVIHKDTSQEVRDLLKANGTPFKEYANESERQAAVEQFSQELDHAKGNILFDVNDTRSLSADGPLSRAEEPKRVMVLSELKRMQKLRDGGKLTDEAYRSQVDSLIGKIADRNEAQASARAADRERGPEWVEERLMRGKRQGDLKPESVDFALWALRKSPALATDLAISLRAPGKDGAAGSYRSADRLMTLFKGNERSGTVVHEILHHSERMMPGAIQDGIGKAWQRAYADAWGKAEPKTRTALENMLKAGAGDKAAHDAMLKSFKDGTLKYDEHYQLTNASEFWAVNATRIMAGHFDGIKGGWVAKAKQWLSEMGQYVKNALGLKSDSAVLKGLNEVLSGNGKQVSPKMLVDGQSELHDIADPAQQHDLTPDEQGPLRKIQAAVQNNMNRVVQVQDRIAKLTGAKPIEQADYMGAETNRPGRIAARLEDAQDHMLEPLMEKLAKSKHTPDDLQELLHAMHAVERNEAVAKINPKFDPNSPDYEGGFGSGMSGEKAAEIIERHKDSGDLHEMAQTARDISQATLDLKQAYGLITPEQHKTLTDAYENYVPLKGDGEYGPKQKRAMGHEARDEQIMGNIARDYAQAVVVGEKNLARQSLLQMVLRHPDDALWTARVPPKGRYVAGTVFNVSRDGRTEAAFTNQAQVAAFLEGKGAEAHNYSVNTSAGEQVVEFTKSLQDNEVMVYVKGQPVRLQIHDETLARQLRPLNNGQMNVAMEALRSLNRHLSKVYTGYNPSFILRNTARDALTGTINMVGNEGVGIAAKAWTKYPASAAALAKWAIDKKIPSGRAGEYLKEYRDQGGKVGASWMSDLEAQGKSLTEMYDNAQGFAKTAMETGVSRRTVAVGWHKTVGKLAHVVEVANTATENALRLSLFTALREAGHSPAKAAQAAKTVTVDFDRKGASTPSLGAFYLFLNPAIQGTANLTKTLAQGQHRYQAWAAVGGLATLGYMLASKGMTDDKDRWLGNGWEKRSKTFMYQTGNHQITIPVSQEYAPFFAFGTAMAEVAHGESKMGAATKVFSSFVDAYFPLNGVFNPESDNHGLDLRMALMPTVLKPYDEIWSNRNSFGSKVVPEGEFTKDRPDNLKMNRNTKNSMYDKAAQIIAEGGVKLGAGKYENDITKVSPEVLQLLWRTYTGGLGTFIADSTGAVGMAKSDITQMDSADFPIIKDFYRPVDSKPIQGRYMDMTKDARATISEFGLAAKAGDGEELNKIMGDTNKARFLGMTKLISTVSKASGQLADEAVDVNSSKELSGVEKRAKLKDIDARKEELYRTGISAFQ